MKYISILRGINVSGQKKIKMSDLKSLCESLGFENVTTYIQSGNVIFDSASKDSADLKAKIERAIKVEYAFQVPVVMRTHKNFANIINNCPYHPITDATKVLVTFLSEVPDKSRLNRLIECVVEPEKLVVNGAEAYVYCPNGYGNSKLSNAFLEKKLGVEATTRNWKSVSKLYELSM